MNISTLTLEELLKLRHQISSRISNLRMHRTELRREHRRTAVQYRAQAIRRQAHNGDRVAFRIGLQSYSGTIRRLAEKHAAIEYYDPFAREHKSHYIPYDRIKLVQKTKGEQMPIVGNVHWIERGVQTIKVVDAEYAFRDLEQAKAQVEFAEASGNKKQIRLVRLAFRQYHGMRYRKQETTPRQAKQSTSKPQKSRKAKSRTTKPLKKAGAKKGLRGRPTKR